MVAHALLTRSPLIAAPKGGSPLDLHVLGAPPAFILSQDRTLRSSAPGPLGAPVVDKKEKKKMVKEI